MAQLRIRPVCVGLFPTFERSNFTYGHNQGVKFVAPILVFVIEGATVRVVVDAGMWSPDWSGAHHHSPVSRAPEQEPTNALRAVGCPPEDVDMVILTHLHNDHCFNVGLFERARFIVQADELRYAVAPLPMHTRGRETRNRGVGAPPWIKVFDRIVPIEGDQEILPGISSVLLPGHSPGGMGVAVETAEGTYLIAGDMVSTYENWEGRPEQGFKHIIPGFHYSVEECLRSYEKMDQLGYKVLPSHDMGVLDRAVYG